jgi:polysaccharide chain length determinant protein (PEP-CTERM system associated)
MQPWMIQVRTYLNGAWHYRWTAMAIAWAICIVGWIGIAFIPNQFQAIAKIYVDTDTMMAPLLKGLTVTTNSQQQVSVMLNTLLTRPNLEQVVRLTNNDANTFSPTRMANEEQNLLDNIAIKPLGTKNLFEISYSNANPNRALTVSQSLLSILVDSNIGDKRQDIEGAQRFLDNKIAEYETLLRKAEQRRAEFREANLDVLSNPITPDKARASVLAAQLALSESKARLNSLRGQLAAIPKMIYIDGPGPIVLGSSSGSYASAGGGTSLLQRLAAAKQNLLELQSRDTADHPDVIAAKRQVAELQRELAATPPEGSAGSGNQSVPNPVYVQTQGKLSDALVDVAFRSEQLAEANTTLENSKKMTARSIAIGAKFADLDRDYDLIHKNYQDLLARRESARLSQAVNEQQPQLNVRIVEPPQKAPYPVAPNRPLLNSIVLLIGLVAGMAAAVGLSINAGRFIAKEQLAAAFDYPVIGVVARLSRFDDKLKATRTIVALSASGLLLLVCYMGVLVALDATFRGTLRGLL